jgi:hypothetical protein
MKNKNKFIENFFGRNGYGLILGGDRDPNPVIIYFNRQGRSQWEKPPAYKRDYHYFINDKKYYDAITKIKYTPTQFIRYIKRIESLISFW